MRFIAATVLLVVIPAAPAAAQEPVESWKLGVTAAAGWPAGLGALRASGPIGPNAGLDLAVARLTGIGEMETGLAYITHVRWIRGGRKPSGASRYWVFGTLFMRTRSSTLVVYPGNVRTYLVEDRLWVMPRLGYGWDHVTRRGTRAGIELTTGAAGEQAGLVLANVFLMWGPPRK